MAFTCEKCRYDLSATPLVMGMAKCPECGKANPLPGPYDRRRGTSTGANVAMTLFLWVFHSAAGVAALFVTQELVLPTVLVAVLCMLQAGWWTAFQRSSTTASALARFVAAAALLAGGSFAGGFLTLLGIISNARCC